MAENEPSQKRISQRYDGAADYPRRAHYLRRWRAVLVGFTLAAALGGTAWFGRWGAPSAYSPGRLSLNHARLAEDCRACHREAEGAVLQRLLSGEAPSAGHETGAPLTSMDQACLQCHAARQLHLPQTFALLTASSASSLTEVSASGCANCHREHVGGARMALPGPATCLSCHGDAPRLAASRQTLPLGHPAGPAPAGSRDPGDGLVRFIPPATAAPPVVMTGFSTGHPPFRYEGQTDPGTLKFNHQRHLAADVPWPQKSAGEALCGRCHEAGPTGAFYQPVRYEKHCAQCHSLQFRENFPGLRIPHGRPELVRSFLAGRQSEFEVALRAAGRSDTEVIRKETAAAMDSLRQQRLDSLEALEQLVFFDGDPKTRGTDRLLVAGTRKFLTECVKCHQVTPGDAGRSPVVAPPAVAERWLSHGAFTHSPHQTMDCAECHGAARGSRLASDLLLPPQALCARCHRPAAAEGASLTIAPHDPATLVAAQLRSGGVKDGCSDCHRYHSPPDAAATLARFRAKP